MSDKSEAISFRVTPEMRDQLNDWAEKNGYSGEADALRGMIRSTVMGEQMLEEFEQDEEIMAKLSHIEEEIEERNRPLWERLFG